MYFSNQTVQALPSYFWPGMLPRIEPASRIEQSFSINILPVQIIHLSLLKDKAGSSKSWLT